MEVVTVLRNSEFSKQAEYPIDNGNVDLCKQRTRKEAIERILVYGLLLLSLFSNIYLHFEMKQLKSDFKELLQIKTKFNDNYNAVSVETIRDYDIEDTRHEIFKDGEQKQSRVQRTADGFYPHFELKGSGVSASGVFTWNGSVPSTGFRTIQYFGYIKEVQILYPGMYRIHAKVAINGRDYGNRRPSVLEPLISPAVGISLMKTNSTSSSPEVLDTTWKTQDDRGVSRYTSRYAVEPTDNTPSKVYPLDTIEVSGQFYLEQNDVIYLQRLQDMLTDPHFERFLNTNQHARFEMHKLPG